MANPARATLLDLENLSPGWSRVSQAPASKRQAALNAASDWLDGKLADQYVLPLAAPYPQDIIDFECVRAGYRLLLNLGFNPQANNADAAIESEYKRQMTWADQVSSGEITISGIAQLGGEAAGGPQVITATTRGYSERGLGGQSVPRPNVGPFSDD